MRNFICEKLLNKDPAKRPTISDLLKVPFLSEAIVKFINELFIGDDFYQILENIGSKDPDIKREVVENNDELIYSRF